MTEQATHFSITDLVAAVEATAADIGAMGNRVTSLEASNFRLNEENSELRAELGEAIGRVEAAKAALQEATQSADQAEAEGAANLIRANQLQTDLVVANDDIVSISSAVSSLVVRGQLRR